MAGIQVPRLAKISYFEPLEVHTREKPYISNVPFVETEGPWHNLNQVDHEKHIVDVRDHESEYSLATNGFEYVKHIFKNPPTDHIEDFDHPYLTEVEHLLQARCSASMVLVYDAIVCNASLSFLYFILQYTSQQD